MLGQCESTRIYLFDLMVGRAMKFAWKPVEAAKTLCQLGGRRLRRACQRFRGRAMRLYPTSIDLQVLCLTVVMLAINSMCTHGPIFYIYINRSMVDNFWELNALATHRTD